ncbi:MAG TPA: exodeoxyribonuclease III [Stellaceae bacterium]|nr:exodeoxyribonuclease III [Stellaceae bacterium]
MPLTIATWNINSVRLRIDTVARFVAEAQPDVLCLQETKTIDETFPAEAIEAMGYPYRMIHGMKGYNGVAILSRVPISDITTNSWCDRQDCRHGTVRLAVGGTAVELHNLYIPAGGDIPDPVANEKFAHKLRFLDEITAWFAEAKRRERPMILVGDLNIAPLEHDVWSHKQLLGVVSHTPVEVDRLAQLQASAGFVDAVRHFVPADQKLYSWWSYRAKDWNAVDRGRRLDHIWVTPELVGDLGGATIHRPVRGWERASDHVPVVVRLGA